MKREPEQTRPTRPAEAEDRPSPSPPAARYVRRGLLGQGGMGEVYRVEDTLLGRELAMKVLRQELTERQAQAFMAEARLTAGLQHPAIAPVYDAGVGEDGRPWFTMPVLVGSTLRAHMQAAHEADAGEDQQPLGRRRLRHLIGVLRVVADAVAFAHSRGVVHRDLKPDNVMLGEFGEVLVLDWGIARGVGESGGGGGTPAYMAPEQAWGPATLASDVYALGAILDRVLRGWGAHAPPPPAALADLVARSAAASPADRPSVRQWSSTLQRWLDGEKARQRARELLAAAEALPGRARALRREGARLQGQAAALLTELQPWEPEERKAEAWDLEDEATALGVEADALEGRFVRELNAALRHDPDLAQAHAQLAAHHSERLLRLEATRRTAEAALEEALLRTHGAEAYAHILTGEGTLTLRSDPPGARVEVFRYVQRRRRLQPVRVAELRAPLVDHPLPHGSYLLVLRAPGRAALRFPVVVQRGQRCTHQDAQGQERPLWLPPAEALGPEDCYVAPGRVTLGGDPEAPDGLPARSIWLPGFVLRRCPVTVGEYMEFLAAGPGDGEPDRLERWGPRERMGVDADRLLVRAGSDGPGVGGLELLPSGFGVRPALDWPVTLISHEAAEAYARWCAAREGRPWRLPHDHEWEKAARGADQRCFPWGDVLDPARACMLRSHQGRPGPAPISAFPTDESPYGVRGLGGNVRDWCSNGYDKAGPTLVDDQLQQGDPPGEYRMGRGGSWSSVANFCRAAGRFAGRPTDRLNTLGFRLAATSRPPER